MMMSVLEDVERLTKELYFQEEDQFPCTISGSNVYMVYLFCYRYGFHYNVLSVLIIISFSRSKGLTEKLYAYALDRKKTRSLAKFDSSTAMVIELRFFMKKNHL